MAGLFYRHDVYNVFSGLDMCVSELMLIPNYAITLHVHACEHLTHVLAQCARDMVSTPHAAVYLLIGDPFRLCASICYYRRQGPEKVEVTRLSGNRLQHRQVCTQHLSLLRAPCRPFACPATIPP